MAGYVFHIFQVSREKPINNYPLRSFRRFSEGVYLNVAFKKCLENCVIREHFLSSNISTNSFLSPPKGFMFENREKNINIDSKFIGIFPPSPVLNLKSVFILPFLRDENNVRKSLNIHSNIFFTRSITMTCKKSHHSDFLNKFLVFSTIQICTLYCKDSLNIFRRNPTLPRNPLAHFRFTGGNDILGWVRSAQVRLS